MYTNSLPIKDRERHIDKESVKKEKKASKNNIPPPTASSIRFQNKHITHVSSRDTETGNKEGHRHLDTCTNERLAESQGFFRGLSTFLASSSLSIHPPPVPPLFRRFSCLFYDYCFVFLLFAIFLSPCFFFSLLVSFLSLHQRNTKSSPTL